jgi:3-deoxy-D-manno-octulosonate 8-phosphate phosphatase (KDO 8-P phosphatase)
VSPRERRRARSRSTAEAGSQKTTKASPKPTSKASSNPTTKATLRTNVLNGDERRRLLRGLELFVFDVDGVLTDGALYLGPGDLELKRFAVEDGTAFGLLHSLGKRTALVSGRESIVVAKRALELGVGEVIQGVSDKEACIEGLCSRFGIAMAQVFFQGDDLIDLPALRRVGCPVAPANAAAEVREAVLFVTPRPGGLGAARDAVEWVLRETGGYRAAIEAYARAKRERSRG